MRHLLVALAAVMACAVNAQTAAKKPAGKPAPAAQTAQEPAPPPAPAPYFWDKEPDSFVGVKLNEPFTVAACPTKTFGQYVKTETLDYEAMKSLEGVCYDSTDSTIKYAGPSGPHRYKLAKLPALGIGYNVYVYPKNGVVTKITVELKQSSFDVLFTAFKERYGAPMSIKTNAVKTQAGAEFTASDVVWKGKKISINMYERLSRVDESHVVISDNATMEAEMEAQRQKRSSEAQKF